MRKFFIFILILFLAIWQFSAMPFFKVFDACPNLVFIAVVFLAIKKSGYFVFLEAFWAGLLLDAFSSLPLGVFSFALPFFAWLIKFMGVNIFQTSEVSGKIFLFAAVSLLFSPFYLLFADLIPYFAVSSNYAFSWDFLRFGMMEAVWNFISILLVFFLFFRKKEAALRLKHQF